MKALSPVRVTRLDVARKAQVSLATVTYSLNPTGKLRISPKTQDRIRRIASQLGYRPNFVHRALSAGRTYSVGLVIPDSKALLFPLYEMIIDGCVGAMNDDKYDPVLLLRSRWERVADVVKDGRVDGLIILQSDFEDRYIREAAAMGVPVVVLNRDLPANLPGHLAACVYPDYHRMMNDVVADFVKRGCRNVLNFSPSTRIFANQACFEGFKDALVRHANSRVMGSSMEPRWVDFKLQAEGLFEKGCFWDGIFVTGSSSADALVEFAGRAGLHPGSDFQLITTDAFPESESYASVPPKKRHEQVVYWQPARGVGQEGWRVFSRMMAGESVEPVTRVPYVRERIEKVAGVHGNG